VSCPKPSTRFTEAFFYLLSPSLRNCTRRPGLTPRPGSSPPPAPCLAPSYRRLGSVGHHESRRAAYGPAEQVGRAAWAMPCTPRCRSWRRSRDRPCTSHGGCARNEPRAAATAAHSEPGFAWGQVRGENWCVARGRFRPRDQHGFALFMFTPDPGLCVTFNPCPPWVHTRSTLLSRHLPRG
jgi:hypothetical protein